jgi:thiamine biosynthesis protein ThiS
MRFTLNGEEFDTPDGATVSDILRQLKIEPSRVAVEVNMSIIRKSDYPAFQIKAGDKIEIVNFVGGG